MEQRPPWDTDRPSTSQEIAHILWNPKVHCHIHKRTSPAPALIQINPDPASPPHFLNIHFNIIHTSGTYYYVCDRMRFLVAVRSQAQI
jgi:hypothetical protein